MVIPPAPPGFDKDQFFAGICWWQHWQLFEGVFVPGVNHIEAMCDRMGLPSDLTGKRVLDVGAWNGCLSFECERRGASEVVALGPEETDWTGFNRIRNVLGSTKTRRVQGSIYDLDPREIGHFDVVLCCQIIYHLRYPLLGIDNLRRVCKDELFLETQVCDSAVLAKGPHGLKWCGLEEAAPELAGTSLWQFYRFGELNRDTSNWFNPNTTAVIHALESAGFEARLVLRYGDRATFHARVKEGIPEYLTIECGESVFYDAVSRPLFSQKKPHPLSPTRWTLESRRRIEEFPTAGVGLSLEEILAKQEPFEAAPPAITAPAVEPVAATPAATEPRGPDLTAVGSVKRFGKQVLRKLLRRSG